MNGYYKNHKISGFKEGDIVMVTRVAESHEQGWDNEWCPGEDNMDLFIGKKSLIIYDHQSSGFRLELKDSKSKSKRFNFPYFVLKKWTNKLDKIRSILRQIR